MATAWIEDTRPLVETHDPQTCYHCRHMSESDWAAVRVYWNAKSAIHRFTRQWISWRLRAGWMVISPDLEETAAGPFETLDKCEHAIEDLEIARAERLSDPYPDRLYPEAEMN
jgi:hypothetical protein